MVIIKRSYPNRELTTRIHARFGVQGLLLLALLLFSPEVLSAQEFLRCEIPRAAGVSNGAQLIVAEANILLKRILSLNGDDVMNPPVRISTVTHPRPNAFALNTGTIVLTTGLIDEIRSHSELAFVIAHELAHLILNHESGSTLASEILMEPLSRNKLLEQELSADKLAIKLLEQSSFDTSSAISLMSRLEEKTSFHTAQTRLRALNSDYS